MLIINKKDPEILFGYNIHGPSCKEELENRFRLYLAGILVI